MIDGEPHSPHGFWEHVKQDLVNDADFDESPALEEAFALLDQINSEFTSDPTSVQCFDQRLVRRVKEWVDDQHSSRRKKPK